MLLIWLVADIDSERFRWMGMIRLHMEAVCKLIGMFDTSNCGSVGV